MSTPALRSFTRQADPYGDPLVIDSRAPRFNQLVVATGSLIAVLTGCWPIFALLGTQLAVSVLFGRKYCLPCLVYFEVVQPRFGEGELEDSRAPRFANLIGAVFLLSAAVFAAAGFPTLGAVLGGLVAALAGLAVSTGLAWAAPSTGSSPGCAASRADCSSASTWSNWACCRKRTWWCSSPTRCAASATR